MAKKSQIARANRKPKFSSRGYNRCGRCGREATYTQRLTPIIDGNIVGGPESYEPRCRQCWSPPPEPPVD